MPLRLQQIEDGLAKATLDDFAGGNNLFLGVRQIEDNESPESTNMDFAGKGGIKTRDGYTEIGTPGDYTEGWGMASFRTTSLNQLIKFVSNGSNIILSYSSDISSWTNYTSVTFTDNQRVEAVQAGGVLYMVNGNNNDMREWNGSAISTTSGGTRGTQIEYYDKRLWVIDETSPDTLNFSGQFGTALGDFGHASASSITIQPGSGNEIVKIKRFKNYMYIWTEEAIYRLSPASAANTFTVELVTNTIGCVAARSVVQVGEDIYFLGDDGIYSLGEVANYTSVRTTNKSLRIQEVFSNMSGAQKAIVVGAYHNFKYHCFSPRLSTTVNDSCLAYDTRYSAWQSWTNIAANSAIVFKNSSDEISLYFLEPTTGKVCKMYGVATDDGAAISTSWKSKSFEFDLPDTMKFFFDTTFVFGSLNGTVTVTVIFDDFDVSASESITQQRPQGGLGRDAFGKKAFGGATNTVSVTRVVGTPRRLRAKGKKFAIQYLVESTSSWQLDVITQTFSPFGHYKFPSANKIN